MLHVSVLVVFQVADGFGNPRPPDLLHEETQVVGAEEQEDRLQASEVNRNRHTQPGHKTYQRGLRSMTPQCLCPIIRTQNN